VINVALKKKTLKKKIGNIHKSSLLHRPDDYTGYTPSCPHILQQNCAHAAGHYARLQHSFLMSRIEW